MPTTSQGGVLYAGTTPTKFGQYQVAEPFRADRIHLHDGTVLKLADHEPPLPVLDQEDLTAQGISTAQLVKGAQAVDALGSCTCNAGTVSLAERWHAAGKDLSGITVDGARVSTTGLGATAVTAEEFAIVLYHLVTDQTGNPSTEWPPTDCGSSGLYVCDLLEQRKLIAGHKTALPGNDLISLLQDGSVIEGTPFFNAWMDPNRLGFVDGDGSPDALWDAVRSGVAGGHETCISAIESLKVSETGLVEASKTVLRVRNSWSTSWGNHGSFRIHLSTLAMLAGYCDFRQFTITA